MEYNCNTPKPVHYNISDTTISFNGPYNKIRLQFNEIKYLGLQKIEFNEENQMSFIDEDTHYIPINLDFIKTFNKIYLHKNEIYIKLNIAPIPEITYHKISNRNISAILINPYNDNYYLKYVIEFISNNGLFPFNMGSIQINTFSKYKIKIIVTKCNDLLYEEDVEIELSRMYEFDIKLTLGYNKKTDNINIRIINLTNMINIIPENVTLDK